VTAKFRSGKQKFFTAKVLVTAVI